MPDDLERIVRSRVTLLNIDVSGAAKAIVRGTSATVYKGNVRLRNGSIVVAAVKLYNDNARQEIDREVAALKRLNALHDSSVVLVYGVIISDAEDQIGIATEYMECSLTQYVASHQPSDQQLLTMLDAACRSVRFLHANRIIHGDIKPDNFLVTKDGVLKICDLGSAHIQATQGGTTGVDQRGTAPFMAPELSSGGQPTSAGDVFAVGMLMWAVYHIDALGEPFGSDVKSAVQVMKNPKISPDTPTEVAELMQQCWEADASSRPSIDSVCKRIRSILTAFSPFDAPSPDSHGEGPHLVFGSTATYAPQGDLLDVVKDLLPHGTFFADVREFVDRHEAHLTKKYGGVANNGRSESDLTSKYPGLTRNHIIALHAYTRSSGSKTTPSIFATLNKLLGERCSCDDPRMKPYLPLHYYLLDALQYLPLTQYGRVFRGYRDAKLSDRPMYKVGNHLYLIAYTSTSTSHSVMRDFAGDNGTLMMITGAMGYPIDEFSAYPEQEVLLAPNTHVVVQQVLGGDDARNAAILSKGEDLQYKGRAVRADLVTVRWIEACTGPCHPQSDVRASTTHDAFAGALLHMHSGLQQTLTSNQCAARHEVAGMLETFGALCARASTTPADVVAFATCVGAYIGLHKSESAMRRQVLATAGVADAVCCAAPLATSPDAIAKLFDVVYLLVWPRDDGLDVGTVQPLFATPEFVTAACNAAKLAKSPNAVRSVFTALCGVVGTSCDDAANNRRNDFAKKEMVKAVCAAEPIATTTEAVDAVSHFVGLVVGGYNARQVCRADTNERLNCFVVREAVDALRCMVSRASADSCALERVFDALLFMASAADNAEDLNARLNTLATADVAAAVFEAAPKAKTPCLVSIFEFVQALMRDAGNAEDLCARQQWFANEGMCQAVLEAVPQVQSADAVDAVCRAVLTIVVTSGRAVRDRALAFAALGRSMQQFRRYATTTTAEKMVATLDTVIQSVQPTGT